MFEVIREADIGDVHKSYMWSAVMKKCNTKNEAIKYINEQPNWLRSELSIEEKE